MPSISAPGVSRYRSSTPSRMPPTCSGKANAACDPGGQRGRREHRPSAGRRPQVASAAPDRPAAARPLPGPRPTRTAVPPPSTASPSVCRDHPVQPGGALQHHRGTGHRQFPGAGWHSAAGSGHRCDCGVGDQLREDLVRPPGDVTVHRITDTRRRAPFGAAETHDPPVHA